MRHWARQTIGNAVMVSPRIKRILTCLALASGGAGLVAFELATMPPIVAEAMGATVALIAIVLFGATASARVGGRG